MARIKKNRVAVKKWPAQQERCPTLSPGTWPTRLLNFFKIDTPNETERYINLDFQLSNKTLKSSYQAILQSRCDLNDATQ